MIISTTVRSICRAIAAERLGQKDLFFSDPYEDVESFVLTQVGQMSEILRLPILILTVFFDCFGFFYTGKLFHKSKAGSQIQQIRSWKHSKLRLFRDFIRFYEALILFSLFSRLSNPSASST